MSVDHYRVSPRDSLLAYLDVRALGSYPYRGSFDLLKHEKREMKIVELIDLLALHHRNSAIHTFEVSYLLALIDPFGQIERGLMHDIGKTGINPELLDKRGELTIIEKKQMSFHGPLGGAILRRVGLGDLAFAAEEHHIGNSQGRTWTEKELSRRHPATEALSLADLICAALDPRRSYHVPVKRNVLLNNIESKTKRGIFSKTLYERFKNIILLKDIFPPFKLGDYQDELFIKALEQLEIYDFFKDLIADDEAERL